MRDFDWPTKKTQSKPHLLQRTLLPRQQMRDFDKFTKKKVLKLKKKFQVYKKKIKSNKKKNKQSKAHL